MRIVKINDLRKESPLLATRKNANSGQKSKFGSQLLLSHTNLLHERAKEREGPVTKWTTNLANHPDCTRIFMSVPAPITHVSTFLRARL